MRFFSWLFHTPERYRHFALVDAQGTCLAFKSCRAMPANGHWVEVEGVTLSWLGKPLPPVPGRSTSMTLHDDLPRLEASLKLHRARLKKLQQYWVPLQQRAPKWVLALWIVGVFVSLAAQCYAHWLVIAPLIGGLILAEIIIDERQMTLSLRADRARDALREARAGDCPRGQPGD